MGQISLQQADTVQAINFFQKTEKMAEQTGDSTNLVNSLRSLGGIYTKQNKLQEGVEYQMRARNLGEKLGDEEVVSEINQEIALAYIAEGNEEKAIPFLQDNERNAEKEEDVENKAFAFEELAEAYEKAGKYDKALDYYRKMASFLDTLKVQKSSEYLAMADMSKDLNDKSLQIELLEVEREVQRDKLRQQQIISAILVGSLLVVFVSLLYSFRVARERRKANQQLRLQSLSNQMNPHFIFNSLNSINNFISIQDERSANRYLSEFARLMRSVLDNSKQDFISLSEEIRLIEVYLKLEHLRFRDSFDYSFYVDPQIDVDAVQIPPMIVQPFVENAIWHGLRHKEGKGFLKVLIGQQSDHVNILIEDDGIGRERSKQLKTRNQQRHKSTGIRNTEERLTLIESLYNQRVQVVVEDVMEGELCKGTRVELKLYVS